MNSFLLFSCFGLLSGLLLSLGGLWWFRRMQRKALERQAEELIQKAEEKALQLEEDLAMEMKQFEENSWAEVEDELAKREEQLIVMEERFKGFEEDINARSELTLQALKKKQSLAQSFEDRVQNRQRKYEELKNHWLKLNEQWTRQLLPICHAEPEALKEEIKENLLRLTRRELELERQAGEQEIQQNLEREARRILTLAINRFARPYCPERGIGNVEFPNIDLMKRVLGPERRNVPFIEKACGVDITINEENLSISVLGLDPVRRELGRATIEKLIHEKDLTENRIQDMVAKTKRNLFKAIKNDGEKIIRELGLRDVHPEVKNMMGSLRYRYSFSQNQYFHCAEVGWLCGLLSAELGLVPVLGRRAGMLHDIGKAMDHSRDGGHAVIGADFIEKHGEGPEVVHAVRAHHFDETPSTNIAYLVIAADALSGARPGARRSTVDSYTQKMADLEKIGSSFDGVLSTYILSAGREVRVFVDSHQVDDMEALQLSRKISQKIEEECSYPGTIRVTVVRETQSVDIAR